MIAEACIGLVCVFSQSSQSCSCPCAANRRGTSSRREPDFATSTAIMQEAVTKGNIPGGVVLIGHNGHVVYRKAFGSRSLEPTREAMTVGHRCSTWPR